MMRDTGNRGGAVAAGSRDPRRGGAEPIVARTRTASIFVAAAVGLLVALLMLVFVLQNGERQEYEFLWASFMLPAGVAMLFAAIAAGLVVALLGLGRVLQLRRTAKRHLEADHATR